MPKRTPSGKKTTASQLKMLLIPKYPDAEIMWAAGFYEGEGHAKNYMVLIPQVNLWPLQRLRRVFGGTVRRRSPPPLDKPNWNQTWVWQINGKGARDFIAVIYAHLSPKRQGQIEQKFITHEKFAIRQEEYAPRRAAQARRNMAVARLTVLDRDPCTGRMMRRAS